MKRPSRTKIGERLGVLQLFTSKLSTKSGLKWSAPKALRDVWALAPQTPSIVWEPMVEVWIDAGVRAKHVSYAMTASGASLNQLIENPEAFETSCVLRGRDVPHITYPYPLDEGPAWEAVQKEQRKWHRELYGVSNQVGRVYCDLGSHPN